jgi:hypothetical protein
MKVRFRWKWSLLFLLALVSWGMWQCSSGFRMALQLADPAVQEFHQQLDAGQYEAICSQAAEGFCASGAAGETMLLLKGVHEKLGNTSAAKRGVMTVSAATGGTFVRIQYNTSFASGPALETFTWIKNASAFKLYGYNVESKALLLK